MRSIKNIEDIQTEIDAETAALEAYAQRAIELSAEIEEARRYDNLTTFQQDVENIDAEQVARDLAYQDQMTKLADELAALTEQKQKILLLEVAVNNAINQLRQNAANIYEGILKSMEDQTIESVDAMIEALNALAEAAGSTGGKDVAGYAQEMSSNIIDILATNYGQTPATSSVTVNVGGVNITGTIGSSEDATAYAQQIIDQITTAISNANTGTF